jgi:hypothetical protein
MTGALLRTCVKKVRRALSGVTSGLRGIRSHWGKRDISSLSEVGGEKQKRSISPDVGKTEGTETFKTDSGKAARMPQEASAAAPQGDPAKIAKDVDGDISLFCSFAQKCPDKNSPEQLLKKLEKLKERLDDRNVCVYIGNFKKLLDALKSLSENSALSRKDRRTFQDEATALGVKVKVVEETKEKRREELLPKVLTKMREALIFITTDPPNPSWGLAIHDLTNAKKEARALGLDIPAHSKIATKFSKFARSLFSDQGRKIESTLLRPVNLPPLKEIKGRSDEEFTQWAQRPGAQAIVNSFGRTNVTVNGQPFVRDKDNQAQSAYAVFKEFVRKYKEKNPTAEQADAEALVFDAMLRSSIDVSTISVLSPLAELTRDDSTGQSLMLNETDDQQKFSYELTIGEGAVTVRKKGELNLRASNYEGEPQRKGYTTTFTMTPKDVGAQTWTETLDTTPQPV